MASKSTNSTIWTFAFVGALAVGLYIAYKRYGSGGASSSTGSVPSEGGYPDYYAPDQTQDSGLGGLLNSILSLFGKGGGGGSPKVSGGGGSSNQGGTSNGGWAGSNAIDSFFSDITSGWNSLTGSTFGSESNPEFGGDSLNTAATNDYNSTLSTSDFSIPLEDANEDLDVGGTFITGANDGSADAVTAGDDQLAETQSTYLGDTLDSSDYGDGGDGGDDSGD